MKKKLQQGDSVVGGKPEAHAAEHALKKGEPLFQVAARAKMKRGVALEFQTLLWERQFRGALERASCPHATAGIGEGIGQLGLQNAPDLCRVFAQAQHALKKFSGVIKSQRRARLVRGCPVETTSLRQVSSSLEMNT